VQFDLFDQTQNTIFGATTYAAFRRAFLEAGCTKCRLSQGRTHLVIDRGNPSSKILIIGEAPGENEDKQGLAFVGRAGKLMDEIFAGIGLDTNRDTLIINVVKCRPPENRAPLRDEVETCMPYLRRQVELVKPRVIVLLGATALKHVVPGKTECAMEQEAGRFFTHDTYPGIQLMVLYHPAYLLYDSRKRKDMDAHVNALRAYLEGERLMPASVPARVGAG
jgi:DNA polymerase